MFDKTSIAIMYAVTPCHAGSGSALGVVDLPIQRERHTNWPMIQASGVKGAFRANFNAYAKTILANENIPVKNDQQRDFSALTNSIFGTDKGSGSDNSGFAGSCSIGDAKILAYPMRSNVSPFVWIICPAVLKRFARDLEIAGKEIFDPKMFDAKNEQAFCLNGDIKESLILLEDYQVNLGNKPIAEFDKIKQYFKEAERLLLVSDDVFNYGVSYCTQIMAQIKIDSKTGTTAEGSLRYQEELPSDTIMYTVIHWGDAKSNADNPLKADMIIDYITNKVIKNHIQIAGDETCGRGIFKLEWK